MLMRILLVQPPIKANLLYSLKDVAEPLALEMVAACIPQHHEVRIIDLRLEPEGLLEQVLASFAPQVVGVTCMFTCAVNSAVRTLRQIRAVAPKAFLVVGGHEATLAPQHFDLPQVDAIAIGEGELIFPPLVERLEQGQEWRGLPGLAYRADGALHFTQPSNLMVDNLDTLPFLARHLTAHYAERYHQMHGHTVALVSTSRGCPFRCTFCTVETLYQGRFRTMSAGRAVAEMAVIPYDYITVADDNFLMHIPRAQRVADLLEERGLAGKKRYYFQARCDTIARAPRLIQRWKEIGLNDVLLGIESVDEAHLQQYNKHISLHHIRAAIDVLHDYGINVWGSFIIDPDFVEVDFDRIRRFIADTWIEYPLFSILTPYPGTELWRTRQNELISHNLDYFDTLHTVLPTRLPLVEFYRQFAALYNDLTSFKAGKIEAHTYSQTESTKRTRA